MNRKQAYRLRRRKRVSKCEARRIDRLLKVIDTANTPASMAGKGKQ